MEEEVDVVYRCAGVFGLGPVGLLTGRFSIQPRQTYCVRNLHCVVPIRWECIFQLVGQLSCCEVDCVALGSECFGGTAGGVVGLC